RTASPKTLSLLELQMVSTVESGEISIKAPRPPPNCMGSIGTAGGVARLKLGALDSPGGVCPLAADSGSVDAVTVMVAGPPPGPPAGGAMSRSGEPLLP